MTGWKPKILAFQKGIDTGRSEIALDGPALSDLRNADFGLRGALRTRPGYRRVTGFSRRGQDTNVFPTDTTVATLAATGYGSPVMATSRFGEERPLLLTRGRAFTYESSDAGAVQVARWSDRLGVLQARTETVGNFRRSGALGALGNIFANDTNLGIATGFHFGPGSLDGMTGLISRLTDGGHSETDLVFTNVSGMGNFDWGRGNGATMNRTGAYASAVVFVQPATNNLYWLSAPPGSAGFGGALLATDAITSGGTGMIGPPVICADYDTQSWFVAYWTNVANVFKVLRVTSGGTVTATYTSGALAGTTGGIWITNSSVADDKVVVALSRGATGVITRVLSHALVDQAIDVTLTPGTNHESAVVGVAESGEVWGAMSFTAASATDSGVRVFKRSLTAATSNTYNTWEGTSWGSAIGGYTAANGAAHHMLVHQPIKVAGRVLMGLGAPGQTLGAGGGTTTTLYPYTAHRWYVFDITDLNRAATTTGTLQEPVLVARSELECAPFVGPRAAMIDQDNSAHYRFPAVAWEEVVRVSTGSTVFYAGSGALDGKASFQHRLYDIRIEPQQVAEHRSGTVIGGAVPRVLTDGNVQPVGFPWLGAPNLNVVRSGGAGTLTAGSYAVVAIWTHVDEAGVIHRSEPSDTYVFAGALLNDGLVCTVTNPLFSERDVGLVYAEIYCTQVNPTAASLHYLVGRVARSVNNATLTFTISAPPSPQAMPLYSDGNVLPIRHVQADGGLAAVGERLWASDGRNVHASRLGAYGVPEAPGWNDDGPLSLQLPAAAGRVVALAGIDDKLIILCTNGVWALNGDGPDDTGQGVGFREPIRISNIGALSPRTVVEVPGRGVLFVGSRAGEDNRGTSGGLYVVDRSLSVKRVGTELSGVSPTWARDLTDAALVPESEVVVFRGPSGVFALDLGSGLWSTWLGGGGVDFPFTFAGSRGALWGCGTEPGVFDLAGGQDTAGTTAFVALGLTTSHLPLSASPMLRGRIRSVTPLVTCVSPVDYSVGVELDATGVTTNATIAADPGPPYDGPEIILRGRQKARTVKVTLDVTSTDRIEIAGLGLSVKDEPGTARLRRTVTL